MEALHAATKSAIASCVPTSLALSPALEFTVRVIKATRWLVTSLYRMPFTVLLRGHLAPVWYYIIVVKSPLVVQ
jgi:hypothetical protein